MKPTEEQKPRDLSVDEIVTDLKIAISDSESEPIGEHNRDELLETAFALEAMAEGLRNRVRKELPQEGSVSLEAAREIMEQDVLGPEAVAKTFGRELKPEEIPAIPFSKEDLERAKELGQFLVLRVDKTADGRSLSMRQQNNLLAGRFERERKGKVLYDVSWYKDEKFFTDDTPRLQWALVTKEVIPGSLDKNAVVQTRILADYVKNKVYRNQKLPQDAEEAIREFEALENELTRLISTDWKLCNKKLDELKLNKMFRRIPAEVLFDTNTYFDNTGDRLLERTYDRTARLSSDGESVALGYADSAGASVNDWYPRDHYPYVGLVFARSH